MKTSAGPFNLRVGVLSAMVLATALTRLLPHPPNFTPVTAVGVFAGATFPSGWAAWAVPLLAMLVSDAALELIFGWGFHAMLPIVYAAVACSVAIGRLTGSGPRSILLSLWGATTVFFALTNLGVWWTTEYYGHDFSGLLQCYVAALPFYGNHLMGSAVYGAVLFGCRAALNRRFPQLFAQSSDSALSPAGRS